MLQGAARGTSLSLVTHAHLQQGRGPRLLLHLVEKGFINKYTVLGRSSVLPTGLTISFSDEIPVFSGNEISFRNFGGFR